MRELSTITCLIIFLYDAPTATSCRADDHAQIVAAIAAKDAAKAEALMLHHLDDIEHSLELEGAPGEADLEAIFQDA
jgi:DNA-binding GntR family transcriptional regulator